MRRAVRSIALLAALVMLAGCSLGGRMHFADVWLGAGHALALAGNHVTLAIH